MLKYVFYDINFQFANQKKKKHDKLNVRLQVGTVQLKYLCSLAIL